MEPSRAAEGPEIVLSAQSTASVAAVAAQSGQKASQERPKNAPERPKSLPRPSQERPKSGQGSQVGAQRRARRSKMKPESQHKRKNANAKNIGKNIRKTKVLQGFGRSGPLENEARGDQNQSLEAKWPKVGSKLGPSGETK